MFALMALGASQKPVERHRLQTVPRSGLTAPGFFLLFFSIAGISEHGGAQSSRRSQGEIRVSESLSVPQPSPFSGVLTRVSFCLRSQQGSTESNATNDEEEMKGMKGIKTHFLPYPLSFFPAPVHPSVRSPYR